MGILESVSCVGCVLIGLFQSVCHFGWVYMNLHTVTQIHVCIYIYIYIKRERERERITKSKHVLYWKRFTPSFHP